MKNKTTTINTALGVMLVLSLTGNVILFNQFFKAKQTFTNIQTQLDKSKKQFQNNQTELQTLQTNIDKENVKLLASQNPSDPNKKLSSGISIWDAKLSLDHTKASMEARGYSDDKIQSLLAYQAQDMEQP